MCVLRDPANTVLAGPRPNWRTFSLHRVIDFQISLHFPLPSCQLMLSGEPIVIAWLPMQ